MSVGHAWDCGNSGRGVGMSRTQMPPAVRALPVSVLNGAAQGTAVGGIYGSILIASTAAAAAASAAASASASASCLCLSPLRQAE